MINIHVHEARHFEGGGSRVQYHHLYQVVYVMGGQGELFLNGKAHELAEGCAAIIFPFTPHAVYTRSQLETMVLAFNEADLKLLAAPMGKEEMFAAESCLLKFNPTCAGEMKLLLKKLCNEERQQLPFRDWALTTYMRELLLLLCRMRLTANISDYNGLRAEKLREYIDRHYTEAYTAEQLAHRFGVSVRHANTIFKEQYQSTPIQYLNEVRHSVAKKLLLETDNSIVSICFEVGYESLPTFYRSFKHFASISPTQYRQIHREGPIEQFASEIDKGKTI